MQKIAVVGSSYFEKYVEQIKTADMFPQVELFFIPDNGAPANIDINFVLNLIEEKAIQAIVLGPFDYERLAPLISITCYIVLTNLQDFLLLHNRVKDYKKLRSFYRRSTKLIDQVLSNAFILNTIVFFIPRMGSKILFGN